MTRVKSRKLKVESLPGVTLVKPGYKVMVFVIPAKGRLAFRRQESRKLKNKVISLVFKF